MTVMGDSVGMLEDNAAKRKERLAALKRKLGQQAGDVEGGEGSKMDVDEALPTPVFRSYKPAAEELAENALKQAEPSAIDEQIQDALSSAKETTIIEELDFMNLAPRKPDWDLKRDVAKKLEKLERRTARAIGEIIRERLKTEDLANAVQAGASYAAQSNEDE
eukprot:GFUD01010961.1.p1 GENE.GFUD01010961.1~~GFUD01010961.1.p1  ORF type:complete len:163 (+),score=70.82 GFUD01010961.1:249-737(+)